MKGGIYGLSLGTTAAGLFKAAVEDTAYGARAINERFEKEGIEIRDITAVGGISKKSPYVMQVLADVLGKEIRIADSEQSCALGSAIFAAVASGIYGSITEAQLWMKSACSQIYLPDKERNRIYGKLYRRYCRFGTAAGELA